MPGRRKFVLMFISVLAVVTALASSAAAAAPVSVSGTWSSTALTLTGTPKQAGVNLKLPGLVNSTWSGDLIGTTVATATFLVHPDGSVVAAPTRETFTGTVLGVGSGTLDFVEQAHAQPDGSTQIGATVVRGTGDLAALSGRLIFVGSCDVTGACAGTYSGQIHG